MRHLRPFLRTGDTTITGSVTRFVLVIVRVLKHMEVCVARGTLILPVWKSLSFWNVWATDGVHWSRYVIDWVCLPKFQGLFVKGKARNSFLEPDPLILMLLLCESTFADPSPLYVVRGFAFCLMESVTLVIRRYFS